MSPEAPRRSAAWLLVLAALVCVSTVAAWWLQGLRPDGGMDESTRATAMRPTFTVQFGHAGPVQAVAVGEDAKLALSGGADGMAILWDVVSGRELRRLQGHTGEILSVALSPDGGRAATAGRDGTSRIYDTATARELVRLAGHEGPVRCVAFSPDGAFVATTCDDGRARVFDAATGASRLVLDAGGGLPGPVIYSADGALVYVAHGDRRVRAWTTGDGSVARTFDETESVPVALALSPHEGALAPSQALLITAGAGIACFDTRTGARSRDLLAGSFVAAGFGPRAELVAFGADRGIAVLDLTGQRPPYGHPLDTDGVTAAAVSRDRTRFLVAPRGGGLQLHAWDSDAPVRFEGIAEPASWAAFLAGGGRLLTVGDYDGRTALWELQRGAREPCPWGDEGSHVVGVSGTGEHVLVRSGRDAPRLVDVLGRQPPAPWTWVQAGDSVVALTPDLGRVLVRRNDLELHVRDATTGDVLGARLFVSSHSACFRLSADGSEALIDDGHGGAWLQDVASGAQKARIGRQKAVLTGLDFAQGGRRLVTCNRAGVASIYDAEEGALLHEVHVDGVALEALAVSPDGATFHVAGSDGIVRAIDVGSGRAVLECIGGAAPLRAVVVSPNGRHLVTTSEDQVTRLFDATTGTLLANLVAFRGGSWAVADPSNRFDTDRFDQDAGCHWVVGQETFELAQLKDRYYEPGLLAKLLGWSDEPLREVDWAGSLALQPEARAEVRDSTLRIALDNRGGGIGRVVVLVNGKELTADARGPGLDPGTLRAELSLPLAADPRILPGARNRVEVLAYNASGSLRSRGVVVEFEAPGPSVVPQPRLFAIVAGVSDYQGEALDLRYARKDAEVFAQALRLGAERLFGADHMTIRLRPDATRVQLLADLEEARDTQAGDVLLLYLAGHGVSLDDGFCFLTAEAQTAEWTDPEVRARCTLHSSELTEAIKLIPALKQVLVLDTCASGAFIEDLTGPRGVPAEQTRALERMKDRTGMYVLAGCSADRVSYEATRFGHGLLTWSLLTGMQGEALAADDTVDIQTLFRHAVEVVPVEAAGLGGVQQPQLAQPRAGQPFAIGRMTEAERRQLPTLQRHPFVVRAQLQERDVYDDTLELSPAVDAALRGAVESAADSGEEAPWVFLDVARFDGAWRVAGSYQRDGDTTHLAWSLIREGDAPERRVIEHDAQRGDEVQAIVARLRAELGR